MSPYLEMVEYRYGMIERATDPEDLSGVIWRRPEIPANIEQAILDEDLLSLGGVFGDRHAGYPVEYDQIKMITSGETVEITVFNRGITLFTTDDEEVRRIHRVLCKARNAADPLS